MSIPPTLTRPRLALGCAVVLLMAVALAGCGDDVGSTGDKGYVDGKGVITRLSAADRRTPGKVEGETLDGKQANLADYRGKVVVLNVWGSWCAPCRAEARELTGAAGELMPKGVVFLGINTRDASQSNAKAFERRYDVPYTSIYDPSGRNLLAFRGTLTPSSIPSTVVIDKQGKVAASILGEVTSRQTLVDLVQDVSSDAPGADG